MTIVRQVKKRKVERLIIYSIVLAVIIYLIVFVIEGIKESNESNNERLPEGYDLTNEDSSLIQSEYIDKLKPVTIYNSKVRNSITTMTFSNEYEIYKYKIDLLKDESLSEVLNTEIKSVAETNNKTYKVIANAPPYNFKVLIGKAQPIKELFLTLYGDSLSTIIQNNTTVSYHLLCKNMSIRYEKNGPIDIFFSGNSQPFGSFQSIPIDILFLKRNKNVYFLIMFPKTGKVLPGNLLYKIVNKGA